MPFTVGDFLYAQEVGLILRDVHGADKVDVALLCDARQPARADGGLTAENFHHYFARWLPVAFVNPHLGSVLVFDSPDALAAYVADNVDRYYVFPPYVDAHGRKLTHYTQYFDYVLAFHAERGYVPHLSCRPATVMWARRFLARYVRPRLPVTVQLRNTSSATERNAALEAWLELFAYCERRHNVGFVVIGDANEVDPRLRRANLLVAKDHHTTVEEDLALVQAAAAFLGVPSGPPVMAMFSAVPYAIFRARAINESIAAGIQLPWATPLQRLVWEPERTERLIEELERILGAIDVDAWGQDFDRRVEDEGDRLARRYHFTGVVIEGLAGQPAATTNRTESTI